ncbi:MAG: SGNH/GDSL hydrolase family protein [Verrucomicrobiales bacterium]
MIRTRWHLRYRPAAFCILAAVATLGAGGGQEACALSPEQDARLQKYMPRTLNKLKRREPVHVAAVGDSVTMMLTHDESTFDLLSGYVGRFAHRLEREFFYTGGVRSLRPKKGLPEKHHAHLGPEISIQSHAGGGNVVYHAMRYLSTEVFAQRPDLVIISYGINDAIVDISLEDYRRALEESITMCLERGVEVIVTGSTAAIYSTGPLELGLTRPFVEAARDIAARHELLFVDLGSAMAAAPRLGSGGEPEEIFAQEIARFREHFDHGPDVTDTLHPVTPSQEMLGDFLYETVLDGPPVSSYVTVGTCVADENGVVTVAFSLKNESGVLRRGSFCALDSGLYLTPKEPYHSFSLEPGEEQEFSIEYELKLSPNFWDTPSWERFGDNGFSIYFPFLMVDEEQIQFSGVAAELRPVAVIWRTGMEDEVRDEFAAGMKVLNTSGKALKGTYVVNWMGQSKKGALELKAKESKSLNFKFKLPVARDRFRYRDGITLKIVLGGETLISRREIEATRNIALGERVRMLRADLYRANTEDAFKEAGADGIFLRAAVDENALYTVFEIPKKVEIRSTKGLKAAIAALWIDARSYGKRREFGYVGEIVARMEPGDGLGKVDQPRYGAFGNGYSRKADPKGITAKLETVDGGARRLTVVIPRSYFYLHEWQLGNPNSLLGFSPVLQFLEESEASPTGTYPPNRKYVISGARLNQHDPRRLPVLELSEKGTGRWSVRLY